MIGCPLVDEIRATDRKSVHRCKRYWHMNIAKYGMTLVPMVQEVR